MQIKRAANGLLAHAMRDALFASPIHSHKTNTNKSSAAQACTAINARSQYAKELLSSEGDAQ